MFGKEEINERIEDSLIELAKIGLLEKKQTLENLLHFLNENKSDLELARALMRPVYDLRENVDKESYNHYIKEYLEETFLKYNVILV